MEEKKEIVRQRTARALSVSARGDRTKIGEGFASFYEKNGTHSKTVNKKFAHMLLKEFTFRVLHALAVNPGGVFLEGLGYFYMLKKESLYIGVSDFTREYITSFHPVPYSPLSNYCIDAALSTTHKEYFIKAFGQQRCYLNYSHLLPIAEPANKPKRQLFLKR